MNRNPLDCGHPYPEKEPAKGLDPRYVVLWNARTACYECADPLIVLAAKEGKMVTCYVSQDAKTITTKLGTKLFDVTSFKKHTYNHGTTYRWRARDADGAEWLGVNSGPGNILSMHKKGR